MNPVFAGVAPHRIRRHRAIFISDVHLGNADCKAELLADFLAHNDCRTLYLIGDIVDFWRLKRRPYWSRAHSRVIDAILAKVANATRVIYIPGNHDEAVRDYCGLLVAGVELKHEAMHRTADGRDFLVLHGDRFDGIVNYAGWLALLGDRAYAAALWLNTIVNAGRRRLGFSYWSLSGYLKHKVKNTAAFILDFERAVACAAHDRGADGVICGHIHHPEMREIGGVLYCNDGDWVESCTALIEDARGRLEIVRWTTFARDSEKSLMAQPLDRSVALTAR
jgi:UDP-2,3-diacylglucosamine pyrophosphatase LpxH